MQTEPTPVDKDQVFTALRPSLYAVAYHMLANTADAEDMVQESFLRWQKTDESQVRAPNAFLRTIVTRLCLKHLQSSHVQREEGFGAGSAEDLQASPVNADARSELADSLSEALRVVLKTLSPLERAVFLLREVFDCQYSEIAEAVEKSEENCRQILRRSRQSVDSRKDRYDVKPEDEDRVIKRFLEAAADGNWSQLIELLSDDTTLVCDGSDLTQGPISVHGVQGVVELIRNRVSRWLGKDVTIQVRSFHGRPLVFAFRNGEPVSSILLETHNGKIQSLRIITCPVRIRSYLVLN